MFLRIGSNLLTFVSTNIIYSYICTTVEIEHQDLWTLSPFLCTKVLAKLVLSQIAEKNKFVSANNNHLKVLPYCPESKPPSKISPLPSLTNKFLHRYFASFINPHPYHVKIVPSAKINAWRYVSVIFQLFLLNIMVKPQ
jgi:hypothetical protein